MVLPSLCGGGLASRIGRRLPSTGTRLILLRLLLQLPLTLISKLTPLDSDIIRQVVSCDEQRRIIENFRTSALRFD